MTLPPCPRCPPCGPLDPDPCPVCRQPPSVEEMEALSAKLREDHEKLRERLAHQVRLSPGFFYRTFTR